MGQGFSSNKVKLMGNEKFKNGDYEAAIWYYSKILQYDKVTINSIHPLLSLIF